MKTRTTCIRCVRVPLNTVIWLMMPTFVCSVQMTRYVLVVGCSLQFAIHQGKQFHVTLLPKYYLHPWKSVLVCVDEDFAAFASVSPLTCSDYRRVSAVRSQLQHRVLTMHCDIQDCILFCSHKMNCMCVVSDARHEIGRESTTQ